MSPPGGSERMHHFFVKPEQISGTEAYIEGPDWNHAANVLRVRPGEQVLLSAGEDWDYLCTVTELDRVSQRVLLKVTVISSLSTVHPSRIFNSNWNSGNVVPM